jgi:hypothetical protein
MVGTHATVDCPSDQLQRTHRAAAGTRPASRAGRRASRPSQVPLPSALQPKLATGAVDDPLEHEADSVADHVMRMPHAELSIASAPRQISRKCASCEENPGHKCESCEEETTGHQKLHMKVSGSAGPAPDEAPSIVDRVLRQPGQPLDPATRTFFEQRLGQDFSYVRIHADQNAAESARAIGARAYTVGPHIAFAESSFAPSTDSGRRLLAHELAHVVQQTGVAGAAQADLRLGDADETRQHRIGGVPTFKHGASPVLASGIVPDVNPPAFWRSVNVEEIQQAPQAPQPGGLCGPDATDWLVKQVVAAKKNTKVLKVREKLDVANFFAPIIWPSAHLDAMDMLEGQELVMIGKAWDAAGKPRPTPEANMQMSEPSATLGVAEVTTAKTAALRGNANAITTLMALRDAATAWRDLVGTRKPYDFKFDPSTLADPKSPHCPDADCAKTITLCPGSPGSNCFEKDLPGNMLFAHVGAFVGFSENALQLGSQWAQLNPSGGSHWDPPEDTQMIDFGFNLPTPLTAAAFCPALQSAKSDFKTHPCKDCNEPPSGITIINPT